MSPSLMRRFQRAYQGIGLCGEGRVWFDSCPHPDHERMMRAVVTKHTIRGMSALI